MVLIKNGIHSILSIAHSKKLTVIGTKFNQFLNMNLNLDQISIENSNNILQPIEVDFNS